MEERYIAAVDLGSTKIALTVAKVAGDDIQILYYKTRPSDGIRNSAVFNPAKALVPIKAAINEAEKELNIKLMQVVVGLPRCDVRQDTATGSVERTDAGESISAEEVESLKESAQGTYPIENAHEELYGSIAQSFSTDEDFQVNENDVVGMVSDKLEGNFKLFVGKKSSVKTIDKVFNNIGIAIARKYFTPATIAKAVLTHDEMYGGVGLIDLGGGATSVTIYKEGVLRFYAAIPFGGKNVTSDIVSECSISANLAEEIKKAYGACLPDKLQTLEEKILQIEGDEIEGYKQIPVKYLSEIITAREKEIIEAILWEIQQSGLSEGLRNGLVITGGGAGMANIGTMIKDLSGYSVRVGLPRHLFSCSEIVGVNDAEAANVLGMVLAAKGDATPSCIDLLPEIKSGAEEKPSQTPAIAEDAEVRETVAEKPSVAEVSSPEIPEDAEEGESAPLIDIPEETPEERRKREREKRKAERLQREEEERRRAEAAKHRKNTPTWFRSISNLFNSTYDTATGEDDEK